MLKIIDECDVSDYVFIDFILVLHCRFSMNSFHETYLTNTTLNLYTLFICSYLVVMQGYPNVEVFERMINFE